MGAEIGRKSTTSKFELVHKRTAYFGKVKTVNVIQHTRSCSQLHWAAIYFYFINQPCALYCVWKVFLHLWRGI